MRKIDKEQIVLLVEKNINKLPCSEKIIGKEGFIFIAGSIMEGFGNTTSDIDVFIVYDGNKENIFRFLEQQRDAFVIKDDEKLIWNFRIGQYRLDCEFWEYGWIKENVEILNKIDLNANEHIANIQLDKKIIDFLHRIKFGASIFQQDNFENLFDDIRYRKLEYFLAEKNTVYASGYLEDIQGACQVSDIYTAFFLLRKLVEVSLNAYLSIIGETNPNDKWIYRKLERYMQKSGDSELGEQYLELQNTAIDTENFDTFTERCLEFSQRLLTETQNKIMYQQKKLSAMKK